MQQSLMMNLGFHPGDETAIRAEMVRADGPEDVPDHLRVVIGNGLAGVSVSMFPTVEFARRLAGELARIADELEGLRARGGMSVRENVSVENEMTLRVEGW